MPKVTQEKIFDGAEERVRRLGLTSLLSELRSILTDFELLVEEKKDANGGAAIRRIVDERFQQFRGWSNKSSGGVDWTKCHAVNGTNVCVGVEVQLSARSDLLIVDVAHLRDDITAGQIDVGVIVVPSDRLAVYLTDRVARFADAVRAVERARAEDLPLIILGLEHDAPGLPLAKQRTRQGKANKTV